MANCAACPKFNNYDDYYTPKSAWENISHLIPTDKIVWEAFMLNSHLSKSKQYLTELGKNVVANPEWDYFDKCDKLEYDLIVSNIPFNKTLKIPILQKLVEIDKPFVIIMNSMNTFANYFVDTFKDHRKDLQIITPRGKIHFHKLMENNTTELKNNCSFYCVYVCYKMNIPNDKLYLD